MTEQSNNIKELQRLICGCADEFRDYWLSNQSEQDIKDIMSLSLSQQRMLRKVWNMTQSQPEGVMLKELAEKLSLSSSAVSVMVDAMVRRDVLERTVAPDDRRKVMIRISEHGLEFHNAYEQFFQEICNNFAATQNPQDLQSFVKVLKDLNHFLCNKNKEI